MSSTQDLTELGEIYNEIRNWVVEVAREFELKPVYRYGNECGKEMPVEFRYGENNIVLEDHPRFRFLIVEGKTEELEDFLRGDGMLTFLSDFLHELEQLKRSKEESRRDVETDTLREAA